MRPKLASLSHGAARSGWVMEKEWKASTGRVSLLTRSGATVRLAYRISRSVKKLALELHSSEHNCSECSSDSLPASMFTGILQCVSRSCQVFLAHC